MNFLADTWRGRSRSGAGAGAFFLLAGVGVAVVRQRLDMSEHWEELGCEAAAVC